jgi:hypothetical protein
VTHCVQCVDSYPLRLLVLFQQRLFGICGERVVLRERKFRIFVVEQTPVDFGVKFVADALKTFSFRTPASLQRIAVALDVRGEDILSCALCPQSKVLPAFLGYPLSLLSLAGHWFSILRRC